MISAASPRQRHYGGRLAEWLGGATPAKPLQRPLGEDFERDSLFDLFRVHTFAELSVDEQIRFHPRLRIQQGDEQGLSARLLNVLAALGRPSASATSTPRAMVAAMPVERREATARLLEVCVSDGVGRATPSHADALALAYLASVHPAHFWPELAYGAADFALAGWLGWIDRGRAAYMLPEVADALGARGGEPARAGRPVGAEILFHARRPPDRLLDAAARRLRGQAVCVAAAPSAWRGLAASVAAMLS